MADLHSCEHCASPFLPKRNTAGRYCSRVCANAEHQVHFPQPKPCEQCGKLYTPQPRNKGRFCSHACHNASIARPVVMCGYCGTQITTRSAIKYCSIACRVEGERKHPKAPCPQCGKEKTNGPKYKFCSKQCQADAIRHPRPSCLRCGNPVPRPSAKYCGKTCYKPPRPCTVCGQKARPRFMTCSPECASIAKGHRQHPPEFIERFKVLAAAGRTRYEIARLMNVTPSAIGGLAIRNGVRVTPRRHFPPRPPCPICGGKTKTKRKYCSPQCHSEGQRRRMAAQPPRRPDPLRRSLRPVSQTARKHVKGAPIAIPLREVYRWAFQLECARTIEAVSRAIKSEQPNHPGFRLAN